MLFHLDPEKVHQRVAAGLRFVMSIPGLGSWLRSYYNIRDARLQVNVLGMSFPNPVGMAAGFDKEARLYNALTNLGFGHVETGTFTPKGQPGNPKPRLFRIPEDRALINRMGFNNCGAAIAAKRLKTNKPKIIVGVNLGKNTTTPNEQAVQDYLEAFKKLYDSADYFVINVSCPNISDLRELQDKESLRAILLAVTKENRQKPKPKPILLKLSPDLNTDQIDDTLQIIEETGIDGIVATNTSVNRQGLKTKKEVIDSIGNGGLSGLPIKDRSTEIIRYIAKKKPGFPIIGVGGIFTPDDAIEKLRAGASLIQVYTGFIYQGPGIARKINKTLLKQLNKS